MSPDKLFMLIKKTKHSEFITSGDDVQWCIKIDDEEKVIRLLFEESSGKRDWENNFNFPVKVYKKQKSCLKVAKGWGEAYKSCNDEIMTALIQEVINHSNYDIHICGWSYGGAITLLAAEDFCYRTGFQASVYTFGAPKPLWGNTTKKYVRSCVKEVKQYAHVNDCVPLLPPLPGYTGLTMNRVGGKTNLFKLFKPDVYHCIYGEEELYK